MWLREIFPRIEKGLTPTIKGKKKLISTNQLNYEKRKEKKYATEKIHSLN